ncbi:2-iminoacetate synthase ThiH [Aestuariibacter sp. A3R04]|uniref:2-iminoacetate synthase ThiH n=1 Tax=Aestuariibacter sp. A3R04 TaxID=2841571 RepID=UPI001C08829E|nr:2-iminoacetate synthase ThiH [Aestuariibacter sp. A3R04]MBU3023720.1 2-iminoacetate synthase ThiH [Aestuariibacter sp. A3R04]
MTIANTLMRYQWDDVTLSLYGKTRADVQAALAKSALNWEDFLALISPAAEPCVATMAQRAQTLTRHRFGNTVSLFVPLYLSNLCANECTYCGFTMSNRIKRTRLNLEEIQREVQAIKAMGFDSVLLVTGEHETKAGMAYFEEVLPVITPHFSAVAMEVQPLSEQDYRQLKQWGVNTVLVYQETYHAARYGQYHLRGKKADFHWRLHTPERLGQAGINKIGLGALLGLSDWRTDSAFTALHLQLLQQQYWQSRFSVAFPRIRPCTGGGIAPVNAITDKQLVQLICAYRLFQPEVELTLSTRESSHFRDNVVPIAINTISAASQTQPGGYSAPTEALEQFATEDTRSVEDVIQAMQRQHLDPVWHDWLPGFG